MAEDQRLVRVVLQKSRREAGNTWPSLLLGQFAVDPQTLDEMQKKNTLERFQREVGGTRVGWVYFLRCGLRYVE